mgnify:CR=1 FL=1
MRIAIDGSIAQRRLGGISEYTHQMLQALGELKTSHEFFVLTTGVNDQALVPLPILPKNFHEVRLHLPQRLLNVGWRYLSWPPVTAWLPPVDLFWAPHFLAPAGRFKRLVVSIHDVIFLDYPEWFTPPDQTYFRLSLNRTLQRADQVITISQATKEALVRHKLFEAKKIQVTPLAVTYETPGVQTQAALRQQYNLPEKYLLMIGTIEPRKNTLRVLEAYERLVGTAVDVPPLVLAGRRGWLGPELETALARPNLRGRVHTLGSFERAHRSALLAGAEMLLFPSLAEGFGLPVLEGMAAGVPVITSNISSLPEVAGEAALLVDPQDTAAIAAGIKKLINDPELRQSLATAGKKRAQLFTWKATAQQTLAVFEEVV